MATIDEIQKVKRRRAMVQALQQQGAPQGQMAGRFYVAPSGLSNLAYLAQALGGAWADKKLGDKESALTAQRTREISDALRGALGKTTPQQDAAIASIGQLPPEAQEAVLTKTSVQNLEPEGIDWVDTGDAQVGIGKRSGTIGRTIPKNAPPQGETPEVLTARAAMGDPALAATIEQLKKAGRTTTSVNVNTEKNLYGTMADAQGKANVELHGMAQKAPELIDRARRVKTMLGSQAITGAGADWMLAGAKVANQLGINTGSAASDTEVLARDLAAATLDGIKASGLGAGSGFSNADRDFLEKVVGGKITLERDTLSRLADLNERSAVKTIERWNATASRLDQQQLQLLGLSPIELPKGMAPAPSAQPRLQQNPDGSLEYRP